MNSLLALDIGNTTITTGLFEGSKLRKRCVLGTRDYTIANLRRYVKGSRLDDAIICSVVPESTRKIAVDVAQLIGKRAYVLGKDLRVPVVNRYRRPSQVGQDRLVNAYAGLILFGAPLIVVDFGTAITFDVISRKKEYLGGVIVPGLRISLEALAEKTALLPKIILKEPREFIGRDTKSSMLSGIFYGIGALTDDMVRRIKGAVGAHAHVIGTGGNISIIKKYCRCMDVVDQDLTLKGIDMIYRAMTTKIKA